MSYEEVLGKRIDILSRKQREEEDARTFYYRIKNLRDEHKVMLNRARENYKELFETETNTEEFAIIGYILGTKLNIQKYLRLPCEYRNLTEVANHAMRIEHRIRKLRLPIILEGNENLSSFE